MNDPVELKGFVAIITYYTQKLFNQIYSQIVEVSEAQISAELAAAWEDAFDEEPPEL